MQADWQCVVRKKGPKAEPSVNAAIQHGMPVLTERKKDGGTNRHTHIDNVVKLDNETEEFSHKHLSREFKRHLMQARLDKKLSQHDLGLKVNEKANVIADYETGKIVPDSATVSKLSKALDVKLNIKM